MKSLNFIWHNSIKEIEQKHWIFLTNNSVNPFFEWNWLNALERSESIAAKYGWQPIHLSLWENERIIAIAPLYLKNHSYGEFIFDQSFARLASQLNLKYYPKLIGMSPLSPIEGYRFFIARDKNEAELTNIIMKNIDTQTKNNGVNL